MESSINQPFRINDPSYHKHFLTKESFFLILPQPAGMNLDDLDLFLLHHPASMDCKACLAWIQTAGLLPSGYGRRQTGNSIRYVHFVHLEKKGIFVEKHGNSI